MTTLSSARPSVDRYFIEMARLVASRSTCLRRSVGCVLVDAKNRVLATGYNGVASGSVHCNDFAVDDGGIAFPHACSGSTAESGTNLEGCAAVHAEQNAILQCSNADTIARAYVTTFPCSGCAKLLLNTGCGTIVYDQRYADTAGRELWIAAGRLSYQFDAEPPMVQRDIVSLFGRGDPLNEWRVVVACVCLNLASARVARGIIMRLLAMHPTPGSMAQAGPELERALRPLGLAERRSHHLHALSREWGVTPLAQLPGVGPYAVDSVKVFCRGDYGGVHCDRKVAAWVDWWQAQIDTR